MEETLVLADSLHSQNARERTRNSRFVAGLCECLENKHRHAKRAGVIFSIDWVACGRTGC